MKTAKPVKPDFPGILKAVSDLTRLRIMHLIDQRGPELCVCDMIAVLKLPQGTISRQLMLLRHMDLVADRRDGKWNHYSLSRPAEKNRAAILKCLRACWSSDPKAFGADLKRFDVLHAKNAIVRCQGTGVKTAAR